MKLLFITLTVVSLSTVSAQTGFVNNGASINIGQGAYINAYDFINNETGGVNGSVDLDGTLIVNGNITNNSTAYIFTNIETTPDGQIILNGTNQSIGGTTPVFFENLRINNSEKTLNIDNSQVKGVFTVNGVLSLNKNRLIIDNSSPLAISYLSGCIKSESLPSDGLGEIEWNIGDATGIYSVPFGNGSAANNINTSLTVNNAGFPNSGSVVFATYPTNAYNEPLPDGVATLDTFKAENLADRYWKIEPLYSTKPEVSIVFGYSDTDVDLSDNPNLVQANLKAIRYNDLLGTWLDMRMTGLCDINTQKVTAQSINGDNFFPYWALSEFELNIPNAFTPNNDGKNDLFLKDYQVKILNRWGELLFEGNEGWDGTIDGKPVSAGTYYYVANIPDFDKNLKTVKGVITVVIPE